MNRSNACLLPEELERVLSRDFSPLERPEVEEHLTACEMCQGRLEALVGDEDWWLHVRGSLTEPQEAPRASEAEALGPWDKAAEPSVTAHLLQFLGPTDDPATLGRIGPYEIIGVLGRGGMGAVYKGYDPALNRYVAIKALLPHLAVSGAARMRFAREAQAAAAVVNDHVMAIHCVADWQGVPYFVMTYSRGCSLQKRLAESGPLDLREILRIGLQTAKGLAAAHAQGLVHRDVKPANIFLDEGVERVQLMDFGLARAVDDASLTKSGMLAGTPQYMSPEQARAETVDERSDLFSLGSVLYAMCAGHAPFRADSSYAVLRLITDHEPRPIREINPDVPEWLCSIIGQLMSKQADQRYESAAEVGALLEGCLAYVQDPTAAPLPVLPEKPIPSPRRFSWKGIVLMLGALGSILVGSVLLSATAPPDISGQWSGNGWGEVVLEPADAKGRQYVGTFSETSTGEAGQISLKWSRLERRFHGTWNDGQQASGKISLRREGETLFGAQTTTTQPDGDTKRPRLSDFQWQRVAETTVIEKPISKDDVRNRVKKPSGSDSSRGGQDTTTGDASAHPLLSQIQGEWVVTKALDEVQDGLTEFDDGRATVVIEGRLLTVRGQVKGQPLDIPYALSFPDAGMPQTVDFLWNPNETEDPCLLPGILEIQDNRLRFCMSNECNAPESKRPKFFAGGRNVVFYEAVRSPALDSTGFQPAERGQQDRTSILGHWKLTRLEDAPADKLEGATAMIDNTSIVIRVPSQNGPHPLFRYEIKPNGVIHLEVMENDELGPTLLGKYERSGNRLWLAFHDTERSVAPLDARGVVPQEDVNYLTFEKLDEPTQQAVQVGQQVGKDTDHAKRTLELLDWATRERGGAGAASSYTLEMPPGHELFQKRSISAGFTGSVLFNNVPGHPGKTFKARLFLPQLSPRGMDFVARNSVRMGILAKEIAAVAQGKRVVQAYYFPDDAADARGHRLMPSTPKEIQSQMDWLNSIEKLGEIIVVMEVTLASERDAATRTPNDPTKAALAGRERHSQRWQEEAATINSPSDVAMAEGDELKIFQSDGTETATHVGVVSEVRDNREVVISTKDLNALKAGEILFVGRATYPNDEEFRNYARVADEATRIRLGVS